MKIFKWKWLLLSLAIVLFARGLLYQSARAKHSEKQVLYPSEYGRYYLLRDTPYALENIGRNHLTVIYNQSTGRYEINGTAKLLPTRRIVKTGILSLPKDEGAMAGEIDSMDKLDWGSMCKKERSEAEYELAFCRAVAKVQAGGHITKRDWIYRIIDGEPAKPIFGGTGGSWGAARSDLRFEYVGPERVTMYQLKPSGRFRVYGTVKSLKTGQTCKNGWIDKDGNVTMTEE